MNEYTVRKVSDLLDTLEAIKERSEKHNGKKSGRLYDNLIESVINYVDADEFKVFGTAPYNAGIAGELIVKAIFNKPLKVDNGGKDMILNRKPYEIKTVVYERSTPLARLPEHLIIFDGTQGYLLNGHEVSEHFKKGDRISRKDIESLAEIERFATAFENLINEVKGE